MILKRKSPRSKMPSIIECVYDIRDTPRLYELPDLSFPINRLAEEVARAHFPDLVRVPPVCFGRMRRIAFVEMPTVGNPFVVINSLLNHPTTPREIIEMILIHEFLHLFILPREIEGTMCNHPPEFWEKERYLSPNIAILWAWFHLCFAPDLVSDKKREMASIKNFRKHYRNRHFLSMTEVAGMYKTPSDPLSPHSYSLRTLPSRSGTTAGTDGREIGLMAPMVEIAKNFNRAVPLQS